MSFSIASSSDSSCHILKSPSKSKKAKLKKKSVSIDSYEVLETVGCGSFAKVSKVRCKLTKKILVWKELEYGCMSDREKQMLCDEVNILRDLSHPNIVTFIDRILDHENRKIYIVQEYCDGGDLASYIRTKKEKLNCRISETFIWSVLSEISSALQHCHSHFRKKEQNRSYRILHRDLKPGNIFMVKRRTSYSVKLGDFGLAKMLDSSSIFASTSVGTPYYMSPEQIESKSYNEKSDIWSLGCIAYEMAMLQPPFKASNYLHLAEKICAGKYKNLKEADSGYSEDLENAIALMLKVNFNARASVQELLCLPKIQFTSKWLRLDRRYQQLKKREHQFTAKMKEWEKKLKVKQFQLKQKEEKLKKDKYELLNNVFKTLSIHSSASSAHDTSIHSTPSSNSLAHSKSVVSYASANSNNSGSISFSIDSMQSMNSNDRSNDFAFERKEEESEGGSFQFMIDENDNDSMASMNGHSNHDFSKFLME